MSFLGQLFGSGAGAFLGNMVLPGLGTGIGAFLGDKLAGGSNADALRSGLFAYGGSQIFGAPTPGAEGGNYLSLSGDLGAPIGAGLDPLLGASYSSGFGSFGDAPGMFAQYGGSALGESTPWDRLMRFGGEAKDWLGANKGTLRTGLGLYGFGQMQAAKRAMRPPSMGQMMGSPEYAAALDAAQRSSIASGGFGSGQMLAAASAVGPQIYQQLYGRNMEMAGGRANADMASMLMLSSILGG